ncbi:twin-arginine translocase subunit TatC [Naasia lichenicola]|uniref:Sec-independent protein translocase protein TatC n=2 Tax=Naasia lichenicola TaxID=2565933 RepID=A0A4S4FVE0_9MICO|nr:twin-arginine translocase subunit TatC [Naasia lichenicola]THG33616.1 twin-arginine translocase subunit TatC [Naasia lichenicola]
MSLGGHLLELRRRLFIAAISVIVGAVIGYLLSEIIWDLLRSPMVAIAKDHNATINYTNITQAFDLKLQIAITVGVIISAPVWLWQVWGFIVPGLTKREKQYTFGFFFAAVPLFFAGCAAGWYVWPHIVTLMVGFAPIEDTVFLTASDYLDFILKLVVVVGVAFILPVFLVLLNRVGVISGISILKGWRVAILVIVLFCAVATPAADVFSMFILAVPMVALYLASAGVSVLNDRRVARREAALTAELVA